MAALVSSGSVLDVSAPADFAVVAPSFTASLQRLTVAWRYDEPESPITEARAWVGRSEGAEVMLELPEDYACPADLDRAWYVREAYAILQDIGYGAIDPSLRGRTGLFLGRLPDAKNIHTIDASTGLSLCGVATKTIREPWVEFQVIPTGHRRCPKCLKASEL